MNERTSVAEFTPWNTKEELASEFVTWKPEKRERFLRKVRKHQDAVRRPSDVVEGPGPLLSRSASRVTAEDGSDVNASGQISVSDVDAEAKNLATLQAKCDEVGERQIDLDKGR